MRAAVMEHLADFTALGEQVFEDSLASSHALVGLSDTHFAVREAATQHRRPEPLFPSGASRSPQMAEVHVIVLASLPPGLSWPRSGVLGLLSFAEAP